MTRRILCFGAVLVVLLALAGCGIGGQRHATVIPSDDVPLLETTSPSPSSSPSQTLSPVSPPPSVFYSPSPPPAGAPASTIYLVSNNSLVAEFRPRTQVSTLDRLIRTLLQGPSDAEASQGISTAINTSPALNRVSVVNSIATIDLSKSFGDIRSPDQVLATAQVVMSAVSYPGVDAVLISLDGKLTQMPLADGTLTAEPLTYWDYASLLAGAKPAPSP
jgi:hypothetical protein